VAPPPDQSDEERVRVTAIIINLRKALNERC